MAADNMSAMISVNTKGKMCIITNSGTFIEDLLSQLNEHLPDVKGVCRLDNTIPLRTVSKLFTKPISLFSSYLLLSDNIRGPPSRSTDTNARPTYCTVPKK